MEVVFPVNASVRRDGKVKTAARATSRCTNACRDARTTDITISKPALAFATATGLDTIVPKPFAVWIADPTESASHRVAAAMLDGLERFANN